MREHLHRAKGIVNSALLKERLAPFSHSRAMSFRSSYDSTFEDDLQFVAIHSEAGGKGGKVRDGEEGEGKDQGEMEDRKGRRETEERREMEYKRKRRWKRRDSEGKDRKPESSNRGEMEDRKGGEGYEKGEEGHDGEEAGKVARGEREEERWKIRG